MDDDAGHGSYGCDDSLGDIHNHLAESSLQRTFGPLKAYLTGCEALVPHPYRFWYYSCTSIVGNGRVCGRTVSGRNPCPHAALPGAGKKKTFRFDVFFSDSCLRENIPPLRAGIFYEAAIFLGFTTENLSLLSELDQHRRVLNCVARQHWVEIILRCKDGLVTVYNLNLKASTPLCANPSFSSTIPTQRRPKSSTTATSEATSPTIFLTPKSSVAPSNRMMGGRSAPASSSSSPGRHGKYEDVRAKLMDLITVIDLFDED